MGNRIPKYCLFWGITLYKHKRLCYNDSMIKRDIEDEIRAWIGRGKTIVIYGARQVGKTTLLHSIFDGQEDVLWLNGDEESVRERFNRVSSEEYRALLEGYKTVIIDEAQRIENIGLKLKVLHDNFSKDIQFIATGSSSFDLANKINEPMTGRKVTFLLSQLTVSELVKANGVFNENSNLSNRLLYGSYPAVVTDPQFAQKTVTELAGDNLYKDVLLLGDIIKTDRLGVLLQALSFQVGNQVSMRELAETVGLDHKTVDKYIALLEQAFIIFRLPSFNRNLRNELKSSQKIYFYDCGIRNAVINDFRPIESRPDRGALFENYILSELKKQHPNEHIYFWRNLDQQEIDFLLEKDGEMSVVEVKYSKNKTVKFPAAFIKGYKPKNADCINSDNYLDVLLKNR